MNSKAFVRLQVLYRDVDQHIARRQFTCSGCGTCCHFDVMDHVVYASQLERQFILTCPRPVVTKEVEELVQQGLRCPFQQGNQCQAREGRVLGCRLHFCHTPGGVDVYEGAELWHTRLKELHEELGLAWSYAPLFPLLP